MICRFRQIHAPLQRQIHPNKAMKRIAQTDTKQEKIMTKRRWLKSVIAASQEQQPAMPFQRGNRRKPATFKPSMSAQNAPRAVAAR